TFSQLKGVKHTAVGYMGGNVKNPTYEQVCTDNTGHAEVVHIQYNPSEISYNTLLKVFWENHDPTTINRQGPDFGKQYRSVIFYYTEEQKKEALTSKSEQDKSGNFTRPIVTQVVPAETFWTAEDYHQKYYEKRGLKGCNIH
ncbi:peptide-methionine (S)-S-oxide reductase MsrA, partial [Bacteroidota bacterium]